MARYELFTSESVTEGHPDKLADQISDAIVDAAISLDRHARVAAETMVTRGNIILAGEIRLAEDGAARIVREAEEIARGVLRDVGYAACAAEPEHGGCRVTVLLGAQSTEIHEAVERGGAGDQGMMIGYAADETPELMPLPIQVAHELTAALASARKADARLGLLPDGKSQVTVAYSHGVPDHLDSIVISAQHIPKLRAQNVDAIVREQVVRPVLERHANYVKHEPRIWVNPSGSFTVGGPEADTGLTGRKIMVDTYGGMAHHGGGSFSGKDPTKVDRSATYMARYIAKNIVACGLAKRAEVQLAYAIGVAEPVSVMVDTFGTGKVDNCNLEAMVRAHFRLTPQGIIESLDLLRPVYKKTAAYGHFGRSEPEFTWERTDKAGVLRKESGT